MVRRLCRGAMEVLQVWHYGQEEGERKWRLGQVATKGAEA